MGYIPRPITLDQQAADQAQQYQQQFNASANAPIPGMGSRGSSIGQNPANIQGLLSGVTSQWMNDNMSPADWVSMLPPGQVAPRAMGPPQQMFPNQGPYGRQAMGMAGLLGAPPQQNPAGLLGGGRRGFRIPYGGK